MITSNELHVGVALIDNLRRKECLHCGSKNITPYFAIELETKTLFEYWHTIIVKCLDCQGGQLERTYHDSTDAEEIFDQSEWYMFDKDSMERLGGFIQQRIDMTIHPGFPPCLKPLWPRCLCAVHWQITEATKQLEPLSDDEMRKRGGFVPSTFSLSTEGFPEFGRSV